MRIAAHVPNRNDATAWYRATQPLADLRRRWPGLDYDYLVEWSFSTVGRYDAAFFQRPSQPAELEAIRICKRMNIPVVVDYDDFLLGVPTDNPAHQAYSMEATRKTIAQIVAEADLVWVSTKELKRTLQPAGKSLNSRVYVVPNALDGRHLAYGKRAKPPEARTHCVLWRGSPTHLRDVMEYAPEIAQTAALHPALSWVFAGWNPWPATDSIRNAVCSGPLSVGEFMDFLYATAPTIGIVPLHDSLFNRCKSNIAWLEMTWAGAACLVPDWEEWRMPGATAYSDAEGFKLGLNTLITMRPEQLVELNRMSWEHIQRNFMLHQVNDARHSTLDALLGGRAWPDGGSPIGPSEEVMELA